jgi:hypothetical protein
MHVGDLPRSLFVRRASFAFLVAFVLALVAGASCGSKVPCSPSSCQGCCDSTGACQSGLSNNSCGRVGSVCTACGAGFSCFSGGCISTGSGNGGGAAANGGGTNASGGGTSGFGGGTGFGGGVGATGGGSGLGGGVGAAGGGSGSTCDPTNCAGCCQGGTCMPGTSTSVCGFLGNNCQSCGSSEVCRASCAPTTSGNTTGVGIPCTATTQCTTGASPGCLPQVLPDGGQSGFPGGWCSSGCNTDADCGPGGVCLSTGQQNLCFAACTGVRQAGNSCRSGYICDELTYVDGGAITTFGFCLPNCNTSPGFCTSVCTAGGWCM